MLKVDSLTSLLTAFASLQESPFALVVLVIIFALLVVGFALYVVLAAIKQQGANG